MKKLFVLMVLLSLFSLTACLKEAAKSVGDAGNSLDNSVGDTVETTINRDAKK